MKAWRFTLLLTVMVVIGVAGCGTSAGKAEPEQGGAGPALLARYGWRAVDPPVESSDRLPAEFSLRTGQFPWRVYLDLSRDVELDFSSLAGTKVKLLRWRIEDPQGVRLREIRAHNILWGVALLDQDGKVRGSWLTYTDMQGNFAPGIPGYSLRDKNIEQVTGLTWTAYSEKYAAK